MIEGMTTKRTPAPEPAPRVVALAPPSTTEHFARDDSRGHNAFTGNDFKAKGLSKPPPGRKVM